MIEVTWKRNRDGMLEAYRVVNGKHQWIGIVDGPKWTFADQFEIHRAASEGEAQVQLVEAYQRKMAA